MRLIIIGLVALIVLFGCIVSDVKADEQNKIIANCYPLYYDENNFTGQKACSWTMPDTNKNCVATWYAWNIECE